MSKTRYDAALPQLPIQGGCYLLTGVMIAALGQNGSIVGCARVAFEEMDRAAGTYAGGEIRAAFAAIR